jgi:PAS domain S-box-containing protein
MDASAPNVLNPQQASALLEGGPYAAALVEDAALVIATGHPVRIAFATPAGLAMFRARDLAALEAVVAGAQSPGARRLRQLAQSLAIGGEPRMEQLRFFSGRSPIMLGLSCARVAGPNGSSFLVAAAPPSAPVEVPRSGLEVEGDSLAGDPAASPLAPPPLEDPVRFLWNLSPEGRFGPADPTLAARVGPNAPLAGESIEALCARLGIDPAGAFIQALDARRTFSALRLDWPEPGLARARVALMSGAPQFDRERKFAGFRGFGVLTGESAPVDARASRSSAPAMQSEEPPPPDETTEMEALGSSRASIPAVVETAVATSTSLGEPSPIVTPSAEETGSAPATPSKLGREGGAEIFVLRPTASIPTGGLNVVPLRPAAASASMAPPSALEAPGGGEEDIVELSSQERDAFREIARALGARLRAPRTDEGATESEDPPVLPIASAQDAAEIAPGPAEPIGGGSPASSHQAEETANSDLASLVDILPICALVLRGGEPAFLNRTLLDLVGFADIGEFRAAGGLGRIFRNREPAMLAPASESIEIPMMAAGGEWIVVDALTRPISWDGAPATLVALRRSREAENQSRLRALEVEARLSSARARNFAAALDSAADGLVRLDAAGRILAMSARAKSLFGYDREEAAAEHFTALLAPSSHGAAIALFDAAREGGSANGAEVVARAAGGAPIFVRLYFGRLAASPEPEYCLVIRDLSEMKAAGREGSAAREKAESASALKTDFLARVSHEIRTPLQAILGFAEVILEERFGPIGNDRYKDYVKDIHASGQHVMSLANDLLDLAKIEAGRMEFAFSPVDANRIIRECVALMQPQAARERIIMRLSLFDKLPNVMADERALRQIMLNLMSNAVKFNEPGGQVIVSTALDESGHPVIRVRDTGLGMNESELSVALEPFRQIPGGRHDDGTGLGLPLTKALVEANHADFSIKSRKEHGTLVEVAFPSIRAAQ